MLTKIMALTIVQYSICAVSVFAQEKTPYLQYKEVTPQAPTTASMLSYVVSLVIVLAVVAFLAYYVSKLFGRGFLRTQRFSTEHIIKNIPIGLNKSLCVVSLHNTLYIIAVSDNNITLLKEISDPKEVAELKEALTTGVENNLHGFLQDDLLKVDGIKNKVSTILDKLQAYKREK